jgi:hypothetical protein
MVLAGSTAPVAADGVPAQSGLWLFPGTPLENPGIDGTVIDPNRDALWYVTGSSAIGRHAAAG